MVAEGTSLSRLGGRPSQPSKLVGETLYLRNTNPHHVTALGYMVTRLHGERTKSRSLCERLLPWTLTPHQLDSTRYRDLVPAWPFPSFLPEPSSDALVACNPPSHARWAIRQLYPTSRPRESLPTLLSSDAHSPMAATAYRPYECQLPLHHPMLLTFFQNPRAK